MNNVTNGIFSIYTTKLLEPNFVLSLLNKCDRLVLSYNDDGSVRAELIERVPQQEQPAPVEDTTQGEEASAEAMEG